MRKIKEKNPLIYRHKHCRIINPKLSKIFLYEKYTNSYEIFSIRLQISYPDIKTIYYFIFIDLMDMYTQWIYTNT